jgi:predicted small lipoprotein YifL
MPNLRAVLILAASSSVAACAAKPPEPAPPVAAATAPRVATDGTYRGTSTRFQADRRDCPHPGLVTLYVQDHQFEYRWAPELYVDAVIDPDGTVHGAGPDVTLNGRRDGAMIDGDVTNGACGLHFTARKDS